MYRRKWTHAHRACVCMSVYPSVCAHACGCVCARVCVLLWVGSLWQKHQNTTIMPTATDCPTDGNAVYQTDFNVSGQIHTHRKLIRNDVKFLVFYIQVLLLLLLLVCFCRSRLARSSLFLSLAASLRRRFDRVELSVWMCISFFPVFNSSFCRSLNMYASAYFVHVLHSTLLMF